MVMVMRTFIAFATLSTEALAQGCTVYSNDGSVVGRCATDNHGTTTLYDRNRRIISRATGHTVIKHDGVSGQVFGDRPKRWKW